MVKGWGSSGDMVTDSLPAAYVATSPYVQWIKQTVRRHYPERQLTGPRRRQVAIVLLPAQAQGANQGHSGTSTGNGGRLLDRI